MTRILVGNDFSEDVRTDRGWTGWWVQRLAWFAEDHDVLVLPVEPEREFLDYVTGLTGTRPETLSVVVPPVGSGVAGSAAGAAGTLGPDRLSDPEFLALLSKAIDGREVTELSALWPDAAVSRVARALGLESVMPGYGFINQAGGILVNSKSMFRTIAGGVGVPIPPGAVCTSPDVAEQAILDLLDDGEPVVVKHDYMSGGRGNEILSTATGVRPVGARRVVKVSGSADVRGYLDERWNWLSSRGRGRPVVERYYRDSSAYFTECVISDHDIQVNGDGELLSAPYAVGQIMPAIGLEPEVFDVLVDGCRRLGVALQAMGYRGVLGPDAIVTPEREVLFTEYNGRVTGSTHIYDRIGRHVVGPGYGRDRMILERVWPEGWSVSSFADARRKLAAAGFGYDRESRTGVVLTNAFDNKNGVMYCIVAEDLDQAWARDRELERLFT